MKDSDFTAVIIDDMELARASITADIHQYLPEIEIIGEADGVISGAKLLNGVNPNILFLDIEMQDGNGFDLLEIANKKEMAVIFVTAREEYALKAFKYSAVDYLLKPIDPNELINAVNKVKTNPTFLQKSQIDLIKESDQQKLALHTSEQILVVQIDEIVRLESMGNYTHFFFKDGGKLLVTKTLKEYDQLLSEQGFIRVHQSHLINSNYIKAYVKTEGGYLLMKDGAQIPVSVRKKSYVISLLG